MTPACPEAGKEKCAKRKKTGVRGLRYESLRSPLTHELYELVKGVLSCFLLPPAWAGARVPLIYFLFLGVNTG